MQLLALRPKVSDSNSEVFTAFAIGELKFGIAPLERVKADRLSLLDSLKLERNAIQVLKQEQGDKAYYFNEQNQQDFLSEPKSHGDALYTDRPGIYLSVTSADCLPILFYNPGTGVVGAFHAGWPGTAEFTLTSVMKTVLKHFSGEIADYHFYLGPTAQVCCYDITKFPERVEIFRQKFPGTLRNQDGKIFLDFVQANTDQLEKLGAKAEQIENSGICTIHNFGYPSHRREGSARTKSLLSIIGLVS